MSKRPIKSSGKSTGILRVLPLVASSGFLVAAIMYGVSFGVQVAGMRDIAATAMLFSGVLFAVPALLFFEGMSDLERPISIGERSVHDFQASARTILETLEHLSEFYAISKRQSRRSFELSAVAIVAGLAAIIFGVRLYYTSKGEALAVSAVAAIAGLLSKFIGGAYFVLYRETVKQMNRSFDDLAQLRFAALAIGECDKIVADHARDDTRQKLVVALIGHAMKSPGKTLMSKPRARRGADALPPDAPNPAGGGATQSRIRLAGGGSSQPQAPV